MIDPRQILFGSPPLQKGTILIFVALHVLLAGFLLIFLTHEDYWWGLVALAAAIGCAGSFNIAAPDGKNV